MALLSIGTNTGMQGSISPQKTVAPQQTVAPQPTAVNPQYTVPLSSGVYNTPYVTPQTTAVAAPQVQQYYYADGSYAGSGSGGASAVQGQRDTMAQYDTLINQLRSQEGRLDSQQNVGLGNIQNSYNLGENRLNEGRAVAKRNYDTQYGQNMQSYSTTRNGIQNNTRATANALQRLLGINGAGNSSAAYEQAPYAAGLQGSQNLGQAQQTYGNNQTALNTSLEDSERQYTNNLTDLKNQRFSQENNLRSSIAQTRANLLNSLSEAEVNKRVAGGASYATAQAAQGGLQSRINGLLDSIAGLGNQYANPVMQTGEVTFKTPTMAGFSLGNNRGISQQPAAGAESTLNPLFQNILRDEEERGIY